MRSVVFGVAVVLGLLVPAHLGAQTLQQEIVADLLAQGFWDESESLPAEQMSELVDLWDGSFAFVFTDREFTVEQDPNIDPVSLLAQSVLEEVNRADSGITTVLMISGTSGGGASSEYAYPLIVQAFADLDPSSAAASFDSIAERVATGQVVDRQVSDPRLSSGRVATLVGIALAGAAIGSVYLSRRRRSRSYVEVVVDEVEPASAGARRT